MKSNATLFHAVLLFHGSLLLALCLVSCTEQQEPKTPWPGITSESRPWTRWWWLGSAVDTQNISHLMHSYAEAGFGGVEVTPLYGVKGEEASFIPFLSPEWVEMLSVAVKEAGKNGMGVDMNMGTGWPFGGPQITPELAAGKLVLKNYSLKGGEQLLEKIRPPVEEEYQGKDGEGVFLEALMGYPEAGEAIDLTAFVTGEGALDWTPPRGKWHLVAAFCGRTRQLVKRAAPGGEGFTMDHFSGAALEAYLGRFEKALEGKGRVRSFFNDSYEVYDASWTPGLFDKFLERRGYDLRNFLREMEGEGNEETIARIKSDYRETLSELLLENFTVPWTAWSHEMGCLTKNQAHGSPGNLFDLYAAVDIPECEIFGHRNFDIPGLRRNMDDTRNVEPNPMMLKLATSAAHVTGKPLISNETFTWLGEHFKVALSQCKPEVEEAFLAGINHVFYHGTPYSPDRANWPGWLFYASVHFGPTNSFWDHLPGLNRYVARCQSLLQSGKPDNEFLVYWPIYDLWDRAEGLEMQLSVHNIQDWLVYPGVKHLGETGYSYDFISDRYLQQTRTKGRKLVTSAMSVPYSLLVIPACHQMPVATFEHILQLAREGSCVVFEKLPDDVPGWYRLEERQAALNRLTGEMEFTGKGQGVRECRLGKGRILLCSDLALAAGYAGFKGEKIAQEGLKFTRRKWIGGSLYFLVNHTDRVIDREVTLGTGSESVVIMDPLTGDFGKALMRQGVNETMVRIQLQPGQSTFLRTYDSDPGIDASWRYEERRLAPIEPDGKWQIRFISGGPELPESSELEGPVPWTDLNDPRTRDFSGTALYRFAFRLEEKNADTYLLDLGKVHESARVRLNGTDLGILWSVPFQVNTGDLLRVGDNVLEIEVASLMANRIRYMDRQEIPWKIFYEINFVDITYSPFDAAGWDVEPSGLEGPVRIIPVKMMDQ